MMKNIDRIGLHRRQTKVDLYPCQRLAQCEFLKEGRGRTPIPFMNKTARVRTMPSFPRTNVVTRPKKSIDKGTRTPAPSNEARKRSSGTHTPARRFRHLTSTRSDILPAKGAPTVKEPTSASTHNERVKWHALKLPTPAGTKKRPIKASL